MHHLVAQCLGFDIAPLINAFGHLVDFVRVRAGRVDHHRCIDPGPVLKRHAQHLIVPAADIHHFGIEDELRTFGLRRPHDVVGRQFRIVDIAAFRAKQRTFELFGRRDRKTSGPRGA